VRHYSPTAAAIRRHVEPITIAKPAPAPTPASLQNQKDVVKTTLAISFARYAPNNAVLVVVAVSSRRERSRG